MDKVCVLMAVYNGEKYLVEQISSILEQRELDIDLYIRLDPSTDGSKHIIEHFSSSYSNVYMLPPSEASGSAGQNFFKLLMEVDFENYDYVAFADQDDIWYEDKLKRATDCIIKNGVDAYSGNVIAWWEKGTQKTIIKSSPQKKYDYLFESAGPGCTFVFKKVLANELKSFLSSLQSGVKLLWLHDWFCYAFARSRGFNWFIDSKPMMKYRQHNSNSVGANSGLVAIKTRVQEVLSGEAFEKVVFQASVLGLDKEKPIQLLSRNRFSASIQLALYAHQCRRNRIDKLLFMLAMFMHGMGRL